MSEHQEYSEQHNPKYQKNRDETYAHQQQKGWANFTSHLMKTNELWILQISGYLKYMFGEKSKTED